MLQIAPWNIDHLQEPGNLDMESGALIRQKILSALHNLQWLWLDVRSRTKLVSILPALRQLPELRALHVSYWEPGLVLNTSNFTVEFPNLTMLTTEHDSILGYMEAPKLSYLSVHFHASLPVVLDHI